MKTLDNDQLRSIVPAAFATEPAKDVSDRYRFISTLNIIESLRGEGFEVVRAIQDRTRKNTAPELTKHMIHLRHRDHINSQMVVGQAVPEIKLINSHDRSATFSLQAGLFRLICSNGMTVADKNQGMLVKGRHTGEDNLHDIIEGTYRIIEEFPRIAHRVDEFQRLELSSDDQLRFGRAAGLLQWDDVSDELARGLIAARRTEDTANDLWTVMNRIQENVVRGGVEYHATNRKAKTRGIGTIDGDDRFNTHLWSLTERAAEVFH
jgi:hypothetical protein